jgi:hypothetical protein
VNIWAKRNGVTGEFWKIHNEEQIDLYCLAKIVPVIKSRRMRWAGHIARMEESGAYKRFWWEDLSKRHRRRGEDNIKMDLHKWDVGCMDWIELRHDRDR